MKTADGYELAQKGAIRRHLVTATVPTPPPPLIEQLRVGANLVNPLGWTHTSQMPAGIAIIVHYQYLGHCSGGMALCPHSAR